MEPLLDAFLSQEFDRVYSRFATARWAGMAKRLDAPTVHANVRRGVRDVVEAARRGGDPGERVIAIMGEAGLGKTHCITTELAKLSERGEAFPVLAQLAVAIDEGDISRWLVKKIFDELASNAFVDAEGRTPLKRLADALWGRAPEELRARYEAAWEDDREAEPIALDAAKQIRRALASAGASSDDDVILAGVLLRADDLGYGFKSWINHAALPQTLGAITLEPLAREDQRKAIIQSLANLCMACGGPLVLVLDQIEATETIASTSLLEKLLAYMVQLVDDSILGTAVVLSTLRDTLQKLLLGLPDSIRQRIEMSPVPVGMRPLAVDEIDDVVQRRAKTLLELRGLHEDPWAVHHLSPPWLMAIDGGQRPRTILESIQRYRTACREAGRFLSEAEYTAGDPEPIPSGAVPEFDKLWQDKRDRSLGGVRNFSDHQRLELLTWYAREVAAEIPGLKEIAVTPTEVGGVQPTHVLGLTLIANDGTAFESWKVAYADAPVSNRRLRSQIESFLDQCSDAKPAIFTPRQLTGFNGSEPDRTLSALERLATGPALVALIRCGGRVAPTRDRDWEELALAQEFVAEHAGAAGFDDWRRERRFLADEIEVGALSILVKPEGDPTRSATPPEQAHPARDEGGAPSTSETPTPEQNGLERDQRDAAKILIGQGREGGDVFWNLDRLSQPTLPNFGLSVSGDAGQGKTQAIKAIAAEAASMGCPILIFDFKNDYTDDFATKHGFSVIDLREGTPFNPLRPPPHGPSGAQIIQHIFEITAIFGETLGLGDQQAALLRNALRAAFEKLGESPEDWKDPAEIRAPLFADVMELADEMDATRATAVRNRLGLLLGLNLLPSDASARVSFEDLMAGRFILSFNQLPNDDAVKSALAEMILIQLQGHMLRGEQPRALRRLLVFDEAWRAAQSQRLIQLAREGRAFGVGVVVGTQFPDDLSPDLVGNLATKLFLYNSDALRRRRIVQSLFGTTTGAEAQRLARILQDLEPFDAVFANQQHTPFREVRVKPYFER